MGEGKKKIIRPQDNENIKLRHSFFEQVLVSRPDGTQAMSRNAQSLMDKKVFPSEYKPNYWLGRAFEKIMREAKIYSKARQDLILEHTKKHAEDGKDSKTGREWKKGDPIVLPNNNPDWIDVEAFNREFQEFQDIEIDLGMRRIEFDPEKGPDATTGEMLLLSPLLREIE
jgi:hypothetical protein